MDKATSTESSDLHQRLGSPWCTCAFQDYPYGHMTAPLTDNHCMWVGGCMSVSEIASAITATKLMEKL